MKVQKENSIPSLKTKKNKEKDFLKNNLDYLTIIIPKEKEKLINQKEFEKKQQKRKNKLENNENLEKRNLSPLLVKFKNFYSLLQKMKLKQKTSRIDKNKKDEKTNVDNCINIKNIKTYEIHNEKDFKFKNINKLNFPLEFRDINCIKNSKHQQQDNQNEKLIYLQTTNGIKYINNSSRKKLLNNNERSKLNSNILCRNIIKKFPTFQYENNINQNGENKELNLPSISERKNIYINEIDYQKMDSRRKNNSLRALNKNKTYINYSFNNLESNSRNENNFFSTKNIGKNNENDKNNFPLNNNISATNYNKKNIFKPDLKMNKKTKIYTIKKNFDFCFLFDIPPVNYYKEEYYYYNIFPENCGWLVKNCFKHRLKWKECHCNNTNLYNFEWKEAANKNEFFDLSLNRIQMINHFEYQSCITNKWKMFYNFSKYCEEKNIDVFKYLPFTIILDVSNFQQFLNNKENFKKLFNNINDYLFDSNSINNKIFDRRKIQYKSLFSNQDQKFGIKIYCEIPKSHFIGKNLWIVKAPNLNRGRCVKVFNNYNEIFNYIKKITEGKAKEYDIKDIKKEENNCNINSKNQNKKEDNISNELINKNDNPEDKEYNYQSSIIIIQKYIERPFLYKGRKCDIRIWALLTHKMEAYIFKEGHLKASSVDFDTNNFDSFVHLTNYSLQKYNKCFSKFEEGNEISFKVFQEFINSQKNIFNFKEEIFPKFREIIKHTMLCAKNKINLNNRIHCFEIFGYDFMMDEDKNIYLIEINTNPGLEISSELIGELVPRMIDDALLLTVDDLFPTEYDSKYKNENGKYKSKFHVNGYSDEENMWEFVCDMKKNPEKELFNSFYFNNKNFKKIKKKIKIKKMKNKK